MSNFGLRHFLVVAVLGLLVGSSTAVGEAVDPALEVFKKDIKPVESLVPEGVSVEDGFKPGTGKAIGRVTAVKGKVLAIHRNEKTAYTLKKKYEVFADDMVIADENARVHLEFNDGSLIAMGSYTKMTLDHSVYNPSKGTRDSLINLLFGKARFVVKKLAEFRDSRYNVRTPTAIAGVRGSDFAISVAPGSPLVTTLMTGKDTTVIFSGDKPPAQVVGPMSVSRAAAGVAPSPPADIPIYDVGPFEISGVPNWAYWAGGGAAAIAVGVAAFSSSGGDDSGSPALRVQGVSPVEGSTIPGLVDTDITFTFSEDINPATIANVNLISADIWTINSVTNTSTNTVVVQVTNPQSIPTDGFTLQFSNITRATDGSALSGQTSRFQTNIEIIM